MFCECGCGEATKLASRTDSSRNWIKDQPLRFVNGHNAGPKPSKGPRFDKCSNRWSITTRRGKHTPWARVVYENAFGNGEELPKESIVHHRNGDTTDDSIANLVFAADKSEHEGKYHRRRLVVQKGEVKCYFDSTKFLAEFLGVSRSLVSRWVTRKSKAPSGLCFSFEEE